MIEASSRPRSSPSLLRRAVDDASSVIARQRIRVLRWLVEKAGGPLAFQKEPPGLARGWAQRQEDALFAAVGGAMTFQILRTAYNVGLFKLLHERPGLTLEEIARGLGLEVYPTHVLLLGLVPMNMTEKVADRYFNNPGLSDLLAGAVGDESLGKVIEYIHHVVNPAVQELQESVEQNRPLGLAKLFGPDTESYYGALPRRPDLNRYFQEAMQADTQINRERIAASPFFRDRTRVLDVGGNIGELAIAIARHHPRTRVTVFDFPEVTAQADARFAAEGLADRLDTVTGRLLEDGYPSGYDCVLFAHFLEIFSPERAREFLARAFACLPSGGCVTVFSSVVYDDERGPLAHGVLSTYFLCLADGQGRFYTARQVEEFMLDVGFVNASREKLPRNEIAVRAFKP